MIVSFLNYKLQVLLAFIITLLMPVTMKTNIVETMDRDLEEWNLRLLEKIQNAPGSALKAFTTDGCSGGLSEGWNSFASIIPAFKAKFGEKPPWETCCVEHDRAYWKGEVKDGYNRRLKADSDLRQCVIAYGKDNNSRLAIEFNIDKQKIEQQFIYAGELMYRAVRLGGKPCSLLAWRWGYGWPHCKVLLLPVQENPS